MKNKKPFIVAFAAPIGTSKSTIANYLSISLNLALFNKDSIRREVVADLGRMISEEVEKRFTERLRKAFENGCSFIFDTSVDRKWEKTREMCESFGYDCYLISIDFSKEFIFNLYNISGYTGAISELDRVYNDHEEFLKSFKDNVNLHIWERDFPNRLEISLKAVEEWMRSR